MVTLKINSRAKKMASEIGPQKVVKSEGVKLGVKLGVTQVRILELMIENKFITIIEIAEKIGLSSTAVENNIAKLKSKGILRREGSDKSGYWEIIK